MSYPIRREDVKPGVWLPETWPPEERARYEQEEAHARARELITGTEAREARRGEWTQKCKTFPTEYSCERDGGFFSPTTGRFVPMCTWNEEREKCVLLAARHRPTPRPITTMPPESITLIRRRGERVIDPQTGRVIITGPPEVRQKKLMEEEMLRRMRRLKERTEGT
jgi:hypothetical protein